MAAPMSGSTTPTTNVPVEFPPLESLQLSSKPKFFSLSPSDNPFWESGSTDYTNATSNATSNTIKSSIIQNSTNNSNSKGVIQPPPAADGPLSPPPLNHSTNRQRRGYFIHWQHHPKSGEPATITPTEEESIESSSIPAPVETN